MKRALISGAVVIGCALSVWASDLRVGLFQKELPQTFTLSSASGLQLLDKTTRRPLATARSSEAVILEKSGNDVRILIGSRTQTHPGAIRVESLKDRSGIRMATPRIAERVFEGYLEVEARPRELLAINGVPLEDYLESVMAGELPRSWPSEAMKAQAVVARTYILKNPGRHHRDGYDFCDLAHCQVYKGRGTPNPAVSRAVVQTAGQVLMSGGSLIEVFFHSVCGGHTASVEDVWKSPALSYLSGQSDQDRSSVHAYCRSSPDYRWQLEIEGRELGTLLAFAGKETQDLGTLMEVSVLDVAPSGWVRHVRARFSGGERVWSGYDFYLLWGRAARWHELKSGFFTVSKQGTRYVFQGRGLGHGIGLCQWGACGRAKAGFDYSNILAHYFPGAVISSRVP